MALEPSDHKKLTLLRTQHNKALTFYQLSKSNIKPPSNQTIDLIYKISARNLLRRSAEKVKSTLFWSIDTEKRKKRAQDLKRDKKEKKCKAGDRVTSYPVWLLGPGYHLCCFQCLRTWQVSVLRFCILTIVFDSLLRDFFFW